MAEADGNYPPHEFDAIIDASWTPVEAKDAVVSAVFPNVLKELSDAGVETCSVPFLYRDNLPLLQVDEFHGQARRMDDAIAEKVFNNWCLRVLEERDIRRVFAFSLADCEYNGNPNESYNDMILAVQHSRYKASEEEWCEAAENLLVKNGVKDTPLLLEKDQEELVDNWEFFPARTLYETLLKIADVEGDRSRSYDEKREIIEKAFFYAVDIGSVQRPTKDEIFENIADFCQHVDPSRHQQLYSSLESYISIGSYSVDDMDY